MLFGLYSSLRSVRLLHAFLLFLSCTVNFDHQYFIPRTKACFYRPFSFNISVFWKVYSRNETNAVMAKR
jgi:hypothetical protein